MEGGDIGTGFGRRIVVIMEPTLMLPPDSLGLAPRLRSLRGIGREARRQAYFDEYAKLWKLNEAMCSWIQWYGRTYSIGTEVWSFVEEPLFDRLSERVASACHDYIIEWNRYDNPRDAWRRLRDSPNIDTVYDADRGRVEMLWKFRGQSLLVGKTPS